jgi:diaminopimelate epimerase
MFIDFEKWHGAKNDFIVLWILTPDKDLLVPTLQRLAPNLCCRDGSGIGADGILVLVSKSRKEPNPEELVIINSDGSLAKNCGNGLRCAAASARARAHREGILDFDGVSFQVQANKIHCRFVGEKSAPLIAVTMPRPGVGERNEWHQETIAKAKSLQKQHQSLAGDIETVDIGNPHVVFSVEDATVELAKLCGPSLQTCRSGDGINVHIASPMELSIQDQQRARRELGEPVSELFRVFPWERGVGLTQACGTGACAVGVATLASGLSDRSEWIGIHMPGGRLYVKQANSDDEVILAGPAQFVFQGSIEI